MLQFQWVFAMTNYMGSWSQFILGLLSFTLSQLAITQYTRNEFTGVHAYLHLHSVHSSFFIRRGFGTLTQYQIKMILHKFKLLLPKRLFCRKQNTKSVNDHLNQYRSFTTGTKLKRIIVIRIRGFSYCWFVYCCYNKTRVNDVWK